MQRWEEKEEIIEKERRGGVNRRRGVRCIQKEAWRKLQEMAYIMSQYDFKAENLEKNSN